jgi:hypothetical protein
MVVAEKIILTKELLEDNLTGGKGFKRNQALALGEVYPIKKGWKERVIGKEFTQQQVDEFISAGNNSKVKSIILPSKKNKSKGRTKNVKTIKKIINTDDNTSLAKAVSLACWLIKDKNSAFKYAVEIASNKYNYPNQEKIQNAVLKLISDNHFEKAISKKTILKNAIDYSVWLVTNTKFTLKNIIDKSAEKHSYKPKSHIERGIRESFSDVYFESRSKIPKGAVVGTSTQARAVERWEQKKHMNAICGRVIKSHTKY